MVTTSSARVSRSLPLARLIFGMINSLAVWYDPARGGDLEALADTVVDMAFQGIAK